MSAMVVIWTGPRTTRTRACGCVERGRWLESAAPWLRWWSPDSRRPCAAHKNSCPRGEGRTP